MITSFGHSTLDAADGLAALDSAGVDVLIDVRSHPTSRFVQWQREALARWIPAESGKAIAYQWWPELGGWDVRHAEDAGLRRMMEGVGVDLTAYSRGAFPKQRIGKDRVFVGGPNGASWTNQGLYDYAWFTTLPEFQTGVDRLLDMFGHDDQPTCAIMCAEAVWWRCHRSMVADVVVAKGGDVFHIQPKWTSHRSAIGNRIERYSEAVRASWSNVPPEILHLGQP